MFKSSFNEDNVLYFFVVRRALVNLQVFLLACLPQDATRTGVGHFKIVSSVTWPF